MIKINRERAEAVAMSRIRIERDKRLVELDVAFLRAVESGNDTAAIAAEKQALRDVTGKDLSALTIDQLASLSLADALAL